ncbi:MAG: C40 family peptidase [Lachnospiraceae bacterium]|nr:C40 family peptidase [Lachnospiraceae bacterium]
MKRMWKRAVLTAAAISLISGAPAVSARADGDSSGLAGFSFLFDQYLMSESEEESGEESSTTLFSTDVSIPENVAIANVVDSCNIRAGAGTNYDIIGIFPKNAYAVVLDVTESGWAHIKSGSVTGYIKTDYLFLGDEGYAKACELAHLTATVTAGTVNVRTEPSTESDDTIIMEVTRGEQLEVVEDAILNKNDEKAQLWVKVIVDSTDMTETDEDSYGYISSQFVNVGYDWKTAVKIDPISASVSAIRRKVISEAKKYIGLKYVWGGTSLTKGADCSGFCLAIYRACGISTKKLPRTSYDMAASSVGKTVSLANAKPGDLVFYGDTRGNVNHVGIYIGNNQVIHESGRKDGCKISRVNYRTILKIKNFIDYIY